MNPESLLSAARAEVIPAGRSGLWFIRKFHLAIDVSIDHNGHRIIIPPNTYTCLFRTTASTLHLDPPGTCVMEDTPPEIKTHLSFMIQARGKVLVTGLGLGCVVRGLLANSAVERITCIEKSADVLKLVAPYMPPDKRLEIIHACAFDWVASNRRQFDYAWHDLWSDRDAGEPHLDIWHTQLIFDCLNTVSRQGAWNYSRAARAFLKSRGIKLVT